MKYKLEPNTRLGRRCVTIFEETKRYEPLPKFKAKIKSNSNQGKNYDNSRWICYPTTHNGEDAILLKNPCDRFMYIAHLYIDWTIESLYRIDKLNEEPEYFNGLIDGTSLTLCKIK